MADPRPPERLDGNAAAGRLLEVFGRDLTTAEATCRHCGRAAMIAEAIAEIDSAGVIVLCRSCRHTLLSYVRVGGADVLATPGLDGLRWGSAASG